MSTVARLKLLRLLDLRGNVEISGAGLAALSGLDALVALRIGSPSIGDDALASVARLTQLRCLTIDHAAVTDAGLAHLSHLPLEELDLTSCFQVTDAGLQTVSQFERLTTLSCRDMFLSASGLAALGHLDRLRILRLNDLIGLDDRCLNSLIRGSGTRRDPALPGQSQAAETPSFAQLVRLELRGAEITAVGVERVSQLATLEHLNLAGCQLDDSSVAHLVGLKNLRTLDLSGNRVLTDAAIDRLRSGLPQCSIRARND